MTIKTWVESWEEGTLFWEEILDYCKNYPTWVLDSVKNQIVKKIGWKPKFLYGPLAQQ